MSTNIRVQMVAQ